MNKKSPKDLLHQIQVALDEQDYFVHRDKVFDNTPVEQLFIGLYEDEAERVYVLEIFPMVELDATVNKNEHPDQAEVEWVHFACDFPFDVDNRQYNDVMRFINFINTGLLSGHFCLFEEEQRIRFHHSMCLMNNAQAADISAIVETVNMIEYNIASYAALIQDLCFRDLTLEEAFSRATTVE